VRGVSYCVIFSDYTEYTVLALPHYDVFRESLLWVARYKPLVGEYVALVSPTLVSQCLSVLPGFGPAAEVAPWRVPKGATVVVEAKGPNKGRALRDAPSTPDAPSGLMGADGRQFAEGRPTRGACPESYRRAHTRPAD